MAKKSRTIVKPVGEGVAYFSYNNSGLAVKIGDNTIDEIFDIAKEALKRQMEEADGDSEQEKGTEVRSPKKRQNSSKS